MGTAPAIIVHSRGDAAAALRAAAEAGRAVMLLSAPGAAGYLGAGVFHAMIGQAAQEVPDARFKAVLDCGADPGLALGALRHGITAVAVDADPEPRARIADIAAQSGAELVDNTGPALDLMEAADPLAACRRWLGGAATEA